MMSSITVALECPVCLDTLRNPVVPPCGHLICERCIRLHISLSTNRFEAKCPTCRASFPIVLANLSLIPDKYHVFINPPLRRVYLGDRVDNKAIINDLQSKIVRLELRIEALKSASLSAIREKQISIQKAHFALYEAKKEAQLALDEAKKAARIARDKANKDAQLALYKARDDLRLANLSLEEVRAENNALKSQVMKSRPVENTVRNTNRQPAFFNTPSKDTLPRCGNRAVKPLPKRVHPADQSFRYFGFAEDTPMISAAREALAVLSSSLTPPSVASTLSGSSTVSPGRNMPSHATNQVKAATASVGNESSASSNTPTLDPFPTTPLLYAPPPTWSAIQYRNLVYIPFVPPH